jgi:ABC-type microcin C transport system permease subunit YejE
MAHETHAKTLPAELGTPAFVDGWKTRALAIGLIFSVIAAGLAVADKSIDHVLRAWLLGLMVTFGFSVGGLALLMVQYCSGGKWGLLLRRPLEAMSRTLPLVFVYWVVIALSLKKLYLWAAVDDVSAALKSGWINEVQAHAIEF